MPLLIAYLFFICAYLYLRFYSTFEWEAVLALHKTFGKHKEIGTFRGHPCRGESRDRGKEQTYQRAKELAFQRTTARVYVFAGGAEGDAPPSTGKQKRMTKARSKEAFFSQISCNCWSLRSRLLLIPPAVVISRTYLFLLVRTGLFEL
ncbi:hypothetical protein DFH06DRAFT_258087 [Mycena polygramma]|nr:hypothetical protein DFH06DRAFT_258087 [Mycena polygramma]